MKFYMVEFLGIYCKAKNKEMAYEILADEYEVGKITLEDIKEVPGYTVVFHEEMHSIGGYNTISLEELERFNSELFYFGNEDEIKDIIGIYRFL